MTNTFMCYRAQDVLGHSDLGALALTPSANVTDFPIKNDPWRIQPFAVDLRTVVGILR